MESRPRDIDPGARPDPLGADFIIPVLGCALTVYYLSTTLDLVWEARVTATFVGTILLSLSAVQFVRLLARTATGRGTFGFGELFADSVHNRQRLGLISLMVLFIAAIEWSGTTLGLFLLLNGCMLVLGVRKVSTLLAVSTTTSAVVYLLLIYFLESRLPKGPIEQFIARMLASGA